MVGDAPAPEPIRMTMPSEPPTKRGNSSSQDNESGPLPWFKTKKAANAGWITLSALVFIGVSIWAFAPWFTDMIYFGMLFVFLALVMAIRMALLQQRNPLSAPEDLIKNAFGSLLLVLAGIVVGILLIVLIVTIVLLTW
ncbi:MAG: hypothetical protein ACPGR0_05490 [Candidatus Poseidoniaceae archaeon]